MDQYSLARERCLDCRKYFFLKIFSGFLLVIGITLSNSHQPAHAGVYQWKDENGKLHFSDTPPEKQSSADLTEKYKQEQSFKIEIHTIDYRMPTDFKDRLTTSINKIFTIYNQTLGLQYSTENTFRILLYGSKERFNRHKQAEAPMLENPAAFYNPATNQITSMAFPNQRQMLSLITHECSHAVSSTGQHSLPIWLNEGLAEYFSRLHIYGLTAEIRPAPHWLRPLGHWQKQDPKQFLHQHVNQAPKQWYASNGPYNQSYATSASIVFFLMGSNEGRKLIRHFIELGKHGGFNFYTDSSNQIAQQWPGGFTSFSQSWQQWLQQAEKSIHRY